MESVAGGFALVWIDAEGARILRWTGRPVITAVPAEIPIHERSTHHVRRDPRVRHGGGGWGADEAARHRTEHIRQFLDRVEAAVGSDLVLEVLGTGPLGERLARQVRRHDRARHRGRQIIVAPCAPLTDPQLVARLKDRVGVRPSRGGVGAYRWAGSLPRTRSGRVRGPRRVVRKPPD